MEVVVVDDGSPAPLAEIVDPFQKQLNVKLVVQRQAGPAAARNAGAAHAHGQFLAFTDDDCAPESGWLNHLAKGLRQNPAAAVGGRTLNALDDNVYSAASQWLIDYMYDYYNAAQPAPKFFTSNNLALPAAAFRELGGFDTSFPLAAGEDRELCDRWRFRGGELLTYLTRSSCILIRSTSAALSGSTSTTAVVRFSSICVALAASREHLAANRCLSIAISCNHRYRVIVESSGCWV